jgi:hypothetical protein
MRRGHLLALLVVLAAVALTAPAAAVRSGEGNADALLKKLDKMDEEINGLLATKGGLKGDEVEKKIAGLEKLLREALGDFPDVWGISFVTVYDKLQEIDDQLGKKPPGAGMAWRAAKELDEELRDNGKEVPKAASQGVYELRQDLDKLLGDTKRGEKEEDLVKRAREIAANKKKLLIYEFPKLFGHTFWKFFSPLEDMQAALEQAHLLDTGAGDRRKLVERAKKLKESIISMLRVTPACKEEGKQPKRVLAGADRCRPMLSSISATFARPVTTYRIKAYDADSKHLTYTWAKQQESPCGVFTPNGPMATWSHPDAPDGNCPNEPIHLGVISVTVSDGVFACTAVWPFGSASSDQLRAAGQKAPKPLPCTRKK